MRPQRTSGKLLIDTHSLTRMQAQIRHEIMSEFDRERAGERAKILRELYVNRLAIREIS